MKQKGFAPVLILVLLVVLGYFGYRVYKTYFTQTCWIPEGCGTQNQTTEDSPTPISSPVSVKTPLSPTVGQFCGGIAGKTCPDGYTCIYDGNYPDAGGHCSTSATPSPTCVPLPNCAYNQNQNGIVCKIAEKPSPGGTWCPKYTCPPNGYVDCMPVLDATKQKACSEEAMAWYKANCPNFQGGAY